MKTQTRSVYYPLGMCCNGKKSHPSIQMKSFQNRLSTDKKIKDIGQFACCGFVYLCKLALFTADCGKFFILYVKYLCKNAPTCGGKFTHFIFVVMTFGTSPVLMFHHFPFHPLGWQRFSREKILTLVALAQLGFTSTVPDAI